MVTSSVVAQYAGEAAFLWTTRARAVGSSKYSLASLTTLDDRIEAHLDGLRLAGDAGWAECQKGMEAAGGGEVFALSVMAFESGDRQRMLDAVTAGCVSEEARRGLVSALGWIDHDIVWPWIVRLLEAKTPVHRAFGIAAAAVRREDPGEVLAQAVCESDPVLRSRALRAAGELKRLDLLPLVRAQLQDEDETCRFWAAWSLTLLDPRTGPRSLTHWLGHDDRFGRTALQLCLRAMSLDEGRDWMRTLAKDPGLRRSAVIGMGVLGDPTPVPWLIEQMEVSSLSRLAGEAFSTITGVDLEYAELDQTGPPEKEQSEVERDESLVGGPQPDDPALDDQDGHLPWPQRERLEGWWRDRAGEFQGGVRHLAGRVLSTETASQLLKRGTQPQRAAAAIELAVREERTPLFEVRGRGGAQRRRLSRESAG